MNKPGTELVYLYTWALTITSLLGAFIEPRQRSCSLCFLISLAAVWDWRRLLRTARHKPPDQGHGTSFPGVDHRLAERQCVVRCPDGYGRFHGCLRRHGWRSPKKGNRSLRFAFTFSRLFCLDFPFLRTRIWVLMKSLITLL